MKWLTGLILVFLFTGPAFCQDSAENSFHWGNGYYVNLNEGEKIVFNQTEVELISVKDQINRIRVGPDTLDLKVARRSLPLRVGKIRIFVALNRSLMKLSDNSQIHGLLKKDALICLSESDNPLLDPMKYKFPVDFIDGFQWSIEEETHLFSLHARTDPDGNVQSIAHQGIDINLNDARIWDKHLIVAPENGNVIWIMERKPDQGKNEACILIRSESQPEIFYLLQHLNNRKLFVKAGQKLDKGQEIGYIWGSSTWGNLHLAVIRSDTIPGYENRFRNLVNFFPQLFELYSGNLTSHRKIFSKGILHFGKAESISGNIKNTLSFEDYSGTGWQLKDWNPAGRVESVSRGLQGNVRLSGTLFRGTKFECTNSDDFFDFEINVVPGVYRIRAEMGDVTEASWQKIEFENVPAGIIEIPGGSFKWTSEKAVRVTDGSLTIRIYTSPDKIAGISELVFQKAY